jgi:hypothetical protein
VPRYKSYPVLRPGQPGYRHKGGRPPGPNPRVRHLSRTMPEGRGPIPIKIAVVKGISLRSAAVERAVEGALRAGTKKGTYRLPRVAFEPDHLHLWLHAENLRELEDGMRSISPIFARAVNRALGRKGQVLDERYRILTPLKAGQKKLPCGCPAKVKVKKA